MTTQRFYRRRFLNRRGFHAGAYVLANCQLEAFRVKGNPTSYSIDAELTIADCGRIATLDFCANSESEARNALHKARLLRDTIAEFTVALETAVEEVTGRKVPYTIGPRREGDPPALVAGSGKLREKLGWSPRYAELRTIVEHAWKFATRKVGTPA